MELKRHHTFEDLWEMTLGTCDTETAMVYYDHSGRRAISYAGYSAQIDAYAAYFEAELKGIEKGSWVGLQRSNCPEWFAILFGLQKIGYPVVLIDEHASDEIVHHFIQQAGIKAIITDRETTLGAIRLIVLSEKIEIPIATPNVVDWTNKSAFCTSGTTGTAKIYVFQSDAICNSVYNIVKYYKSNPALKRRENLDPNKNNAILALPFRHISGFLMTVAFWALGRSLVMPKGKGILQLLETIRIEEIWLLFCVPAMWKAITRILISKYGTCEASSFQKLFGKNLKVGLSAAALLDDDMIAQLSKSGIYILNCWGMTETGICSIGALEDCTESGYVGELMNEHTLSFAENSASTSVGELILEGKSLFYAIMKDGKEQKRTESFHTGDVFRFENGKLWFLGRCKSVIVGESGENVYPEELDEAFSFLSERTGMYCTVGWRDEPVLILQTDNADDFEKTIWFQKIKERNRQLPFIKQITRLILVKQSLPITAKGEPARSALTAEWILHNQTKTIVMKGKKG